MRCVEQKIKKGEGVICAVQAADRDEGFFTDPDPETFDIHRKHDIKDVLGFGWGIHRCQAEWLSKAELEIVFGELRFLFATREWIFEGNDLRCFWKEEGVIGEGER